MTLLNHFKDLHRAIEDDDLELIHQYSSQILDMAPTDLNVLSVKLILNIIQDNITNALSMFTSDPRLVEALPLEHAYCLYRDNQTSLALTNIDSIDPEINEDLFSLLKSQLLYKSRKFKDAEQLLSTFDQDDVEAFTNLIACQINTGNCLFPKQIPTSDSFAFYLNMGLLACQCGLYTKAIELLTHGITLTNSENLRNQGKLELALAYLLNNQKEQSEVILTELIKSISFEKSSEVYGGPISALTNGGRVCLRGIDKEFFRLVKWTRKYQTEGLTIEQTLGLLSNHVVLLLLLGKLKEAKGLIDNALEQINSEMELNQSKLISDLRDRFLLLLLYFYQKDKKITKVDDLFSEWVRDHNITSTIVFAFAQSLVERNLITQAIKILNFLVKSDLWKNSPLDLVKCILSLSELYSFLGDEISIENLFDTRKSDQIYAFCYGVYLVNISMKFLKKGDIIKSEQLGSEAVEMIKSSKLSFIDPNYQKSCLVKALSLSPSHPDHHTIPTLLNQLNTVLTPSSQPSVSADVAEHLPASDLPQATLTQHVRVIKKNKQKKKRKTKVPASVAPEDVGKPDPLRWCSKKERNVKRGKKIALKDRVSGLGHQGGVPVAGVEVYVPEKKVSTGRVVETKKGGKPKPKRKR
ncbi:hypothetical protein RCL1_009139 [Eukaryota sp. TZLM3-RCL]